MSLVKSHFFRAQSYQKANKSNFLTEEEGELALNAVDSGIETINKLVDQSTPNFHRAWALKVKGEIFQDLKKYDKAEDYFKAAHTEATQVFTSEHPCIIVFNGSLLDALNLSEDAEKRS